MQPYLMRMFKYIKYLLISRKSRLIAARLQYLEDQVSTLSSYVRYLAAPVRNELPLADQTRQSFDFQWERIPSSRHLLNNPRFKQEVIDLVLNFTNLPEEWFAGKKVVDVGCGSGRFSWAFCQLGAEVLSLEQSDHGLNKTAEECRDFTGHRTQKINLLEKLPVNEVFDLVWSFGVLHHTGDTYTAFKNVANLVKPGGRIFLMLYGEPRTNELDDYQDVNQYEYWRRKTCHMTFDEKLDAITEAMQGGEFLTHGEEYIHGYFDAISPSINDMYRWEEIVLWLTNEGFVDIQRTANNRNHHLIATKRLDA